MDSESIEEIAIDIKNLVFSYKNNIKVINNLWLQIPKGKIFALLGSNGCGKTSLIRLILGLIQSNKGSIDVFGVRAGSKGSDIPGKGVGYMPQNLSLFEELSVEEIIIFYGKLFHLSFAQIIIKIKNLTKLLNLPEKQRIISQLSGGQKRLLSMAITLIHSPKLIILDEPTVGVDSLLRFRIWKYLEEICYKNGQTVLITTHYIDEAKSAANVAFMSSGTVLKQSNPYNMMTEFQCNSLEVIYFKLESNPKHIPKTQEVEHKPKEKHKRQLSKIKMNGNSLDFTRIDVLFRNYYNVNKRRPILWCLYITLTAFGFILMNLCMGQMPDDIPLAVYNGDQSSELSQLFIDSIDKKVFHLTQYSNNRTAFESVLKGNNYLSIVFTQNYSQAFDSRIINQFQTSDEDLDNSRLKIYADFSNPPISLFVFQNLIKTFNTFSNNFGFDFVQYFTPIQIEESIYGNNYSNIDYSLYFLPGLLIFTAYFYTIIITTNELLFKSGDNFERLKGAGVQHLEYFIANILQRIPIILLLSVISIAISFGVLGYELKGSYFDVFLLLLLQGIQGLLFGLLVENLLKGPEEKMMTVATYLFPLCLLTGLFWPTESFPLYMAYLTDWLPITQPLKALRAVIFKGWTYDRPLVLYGYVVSFGYILLFVIINVFSFKFKQI